MDTSETALNVFERTIKRYVPENRNSIVIKNITDIWKVMYDLTTIGDHLNVDTLNGGLDYFNSLRIENLFLYIIRKSPDERSQAIRTKPERLYLYQDTNKRRNLVCLVNHIKPITIEEFFGGSNEEERFLIESNGQLYDPNKLIPEKLRTLEPYIDIINTTQNTAILIYPRGSELQNESGRRNILESVIDKIRLEKLIGV